MKAWINRVLPKGSFLRWVLIGLIKNPFLFPVAFVRSAYASWRLVGFVGGMPVRLSAGQTFRVQRSRRSTVELFGVFCVQSWGGSSLPSSISIGVGAKVKIGGDFTIGPAVHINVMDGAELLLGGRNTSTGSGITCEARVMVSKRVEIGADTIIAWGVFVSDSDWHEFDGVVRCSPVVIGEHVWVSHGCSILRGAKIPRGSVVGAKSLVASAFDGEKLLVKGIPATVVRTGVEWLR